MSKINTGVTTPNTSVLIPMIRNIMPTLVAQQITSVQPMTGAVYSAYNASLSYTSLFDTKYYYSKFDGHNKKYWPHQVELKNFSSLVPTEQWCYQNFKSRNWRNYGKYFAFKREEDYALFLLKWTS